MALQIIVNSFIAAGIYALVGVGFGLIYKVARFFHFAHAAVYASGAYFCYTAYIIWNWPFWLAVVISLFGAAGLGALMDVCIYRFLRKQFASADVLLLVSLGLFVVLQNFLSIVFGDDTKALRRGGISAGHDILGARITVAQMAIIVGSITLLTLAWLLMKHTRIGRILRAISSDQELATVLGLNSSRYLLFAFILGSLLAGAGAILNSFDTDLSPLMGFHALMMGMVAVIVGGVGSIPGTGVGALLLGLAQNLGVWKIHTEWQDAIAFIILLVFLLVRPQGFFGSALKRETV